MTVSTLVLILVAVQESWAVAGCDDCPLAYECTVIGCYHFASGDLNYWDYHCSFNGGSGWRYWEDTGERECLVNCLAPQPMPRKAG